MKISIAPGSRRILGTAVALWMALVGGTAALAQSSQGSSAPSAQASASDAATPPPQSNPKRVSAVVTQVQALRKEGRNAQALEALEAALKTAPRDAQLRFLYGVTVAEAGRRDDAIAVFESLVADFPELPEPHNNLAVMHAAAGELDKARAALENAVRALPGYALAHENLGDLYLRLAVRSWERAEQADAGNRSAAARLALARELIQRITPAPASNAAPTRN